MSMNRVVLIGRLAREPELRLTANGTAVANFTLAVDRRKSSSEEQKTDFIRITVWDKQAENCQTYLGKGRLVAIDGRLQISKYRDKEGKDRTSAEVVAEQVQFLDRAPDGGQNNGYGGRAQAGNGDFGDGDFNSTSEGGDWNEDEPPF